MFPRNDCCPLRRSAFVPRVPGTALMPFYALQILYNLSNHPVPISSDNQKAGVTGVPSVIDTGVIITDDKNYQYFMRK
jgi:ribose transport system substrate-binding protein